MRPTTFSLLAVLGATVLVGGAVAQGRGGPGGPGRGMGGGARMGAGPGAGMGPGACMGLGPGAGMGRGARMMGGGMGQGGWWARVSAETPEQQAVLGKLTQMHADIRLAQQELMTLRSQNAPAQSIDAKQKEVAALRAGLQKFQVANRAVLQTLAGPGVRGMANGAGPRGRGAGFQAGVGCPGCPNPGANCATCPDYGVSCPGCPGCPGGGQGRGPGGGPRDGSGPNPNCPLKK